jgi:DNA polymerase I-like protein with 3'-5' exonuclease and polymerase domains
MKTTAFDTETCLIGPGAVAPRIICASFYDGDKAELVGNNDISYLESRIEEMLKSDNIVCAFAAFDLSVVCNAFPKLVPLVFKALDEGRVHDVQLMEKLHNLGTSGILDYKELPDGNTSKVSYSLAELEKSYLGIDRSEQKTGEGIWRYNYESLDGWASENYPTNAYNYAVDDAVNTYKVFKAMEDIGLANQETESFQVKASFALYQMTALGWRIDPVEVRKIQAWVEEELDDSKHPLLFESGILRPRQPARPYANGALDPDGQPKMKAEKPPSLNRTRLKEVVAEVSDRIGIEPKLTEKGAISTDKEVLSKVAPFDPVLEKFAERQQLAKLQSTYIPQFLDEENNVVSRVYSGYDALKKTGRTSSKKSKLYPSCNIQQEDPRVRQCFIPDDGFVLCSADYSALELCSAAWRCQDLFGNSKMVELLSKGVDLHAYTGSVLAYTLDEDFRRSSQSLSESDRYEMFVKVKEYDPHFFKHYRTFAKPTGLGYLGGLGTDTFISYAKTTYGIDLEEIAEDRGTSAGELASTIKEAWLGAFPEIRNYFYWVEEECKDRDDLYQYRSPLGMVRRGASYTAATNGAAMQTPAAEGAKSAVYNVVKECYLESDSPLYGCYPLAFIHDEIIIQIPDNESRTAAANRLCEVMRESMEEILTGVPITVEPALMMNWDKGAQTVIDEKGELQVWTKI